MRANLGVKNNIDKNVMKELKKGDILYSAVYDNSTETTDVEKFVFEEYVKSPNNSKGVWAKYVEIVSEKEDGTYEVATKSYKNENGKTENVPDWRVNDISVGLFLNPLSALEAWEKVTEKLNSSAKRAVEIYKRGE